MAFDGVITVRLPIPPTANNLFFNLKTGGRARTQAYKKWLHTARAECLSAYDRAGKPEIDPKQKMRLHLRVGIGYRRDLSNVCKPVEDAMCAFLPVPDDRYNDVVLIERDLDCEGFVIATLGPIDVGE